MTMHRELNPQLFGNQTQVEKIGQPVDPQRPAPSIMGTGATAHPSAAGAGSGLGGGASAAFGASSGAGHRGYSPSGADFKALEHQVATMKVSLMQVERRTEMLSSRLEDLQKNTHARMERFAQAIMRMEEINGQHHQENTAKFATVFGKMNERKVTDSKVQELIDRHNTIIRNFENRLLSLQRVISEQELALHNAQAALEESRIGRR